MAATLLVLAGVSDLVLASTGGPDLAEPLGWDQAAREVYFRIRSQDESGDAPRIVRLRMRQQSTGFQSLSWSIGARPDSAYMRKLRQVTRRLRPLKEMLNTTVPEMFKIMSTDTIANPFGRWPRFRVRASWFGGVPQGWIEATTYRDPSLRMIRLFRIPAHDDLIGVVSFIGKPYEFGYEVQIPLLLSRDRKSVSIVRPIR
jgi:hypothetical protein